jgi:methylenetetrahydrofolate reductase (NADPH)
VSLKKSLENKRFLVSCEIHLTEEKNPEDYLEEIYNVLEPVDAVCLHPLSTETATEVSLALCRLLLQKGLDPVFQVDTRNRNRLEIQDTLIDASSTGVTNLLVFSDDYRITGDSLDEMMFFHVDMGKFFSVIDSLRQGIDVRGRELEGPKEFLIGSCVEAGFGGNVPDMELREMEELVERGARYFLTTPVFDVDQFSRFVKRVAPLGVPIIAELVLLHSGMTGRMLRRLARLDIPNHIIRRLEKAPVKFDESAKILLETVDRLQGICAGVHILPFGWEDKIGKIIQHIKGIEMNSQV